MARSSPSLSCLGQCPDVCEACRGNPRLWEPLVVAELVLSSSIMWLNKLNQDGAELMDPFAVADPCEPAKALLTVRVHRRGQDICVSYEKCTTSGLLISAQCHRCGPGGNIASLKEKKTSLRDTGAVSLTSIGVASDRSGIIKITLEVSRRRALPVALPPAMQAARESGKFCDVTLTADGRDFPVHRVVLAAASDVFDKTFTAPFMEKGADRVKILEVSAKSFAKFLDFLYVDGCPEDCELELLELANRYQVHRLKALCESCLWWLGGARALAVLRRASSSPLLAPAVLDRLCRQVAMLVGTLDDLPDWQALQEDNPYLAGVIEGIAKCGGPLTSISHSLL